MSILLLILKLFPILMAVMQTVETTAPLPRIGASKLSLVKSVVVSAFQAEVTDKSTISQDQLLTLIEAVTAQIVAFYNLVGIFKKSS